ncbi:hypothetical protein [Trueperella bernardiae]|uniref:hypothetical protein n=1 Tax=Trueperella bernardiae TaxID=59561 RepID=UPI00294B4C01|nr:hypothetical protein [Trueperella bernardiae]
MTTTPVHTFTHHPLIPISMETPPPETPTRTRGQSPDPTLAFLHIGRAELDAATTMHPELAQPRNPRSQRHRGARTNDRNTTTATSASRWLFSECLTHAINRENKFTETGQIIGPTLTRRRILKPDNNGHFTSREAGIIADNSDGLIMIELDSPDVISLVFSDINRPLRDQIRVASYLVGLYSQAIRVNRSALRPLSDLVTILRDLISAQCDHDRPESDPSRDASHENTDPTHTSS